MQLQKLYSLHICVNCKCFLRKLLRSEKNANILKSEQYYKFTCWIMNLLTYLFSNIFYFTKYTQKETASQLYLLNILYNFDWVYITCVLISKTLFTLYLVCNILYATAFYLYFTSLHENKIWKIKKQVKLILLIFWIFHSEFNFQSWMSANKAVVSWICTSEFLNIFVKFKEKNQKIYDEKL